MKPEDEAAAIAASEKLRKDNEEYLKNRADYYAPMLPALRVLHEHEKLQTELHEFRLRSKVAMFHLAEFEASQKPAPKTPEKV